MIDRVRFALARLTGNEPELARFSFPIADLMGELKGASVALIGNARALAETGYGAEIDGASLVIRINGAPIPAVKSHGSKTDWMAISTPVDPATIAARSPKRIIWMTDKRKRLTYSLAADPRFALAPAVWNADLTARLGKRPTTGLMLIDLLSRSEVKSYTTYGFDFFRSLSLSGRRTAADVPHDFNAEQAFVTALAARDPRLILRPS